ncbi:MAG: hypothetical protein GY863_14290 [bacterium]|nr:hypothetical protein [bacterium]
MIEIEIKVKVGKKVVTLNHEEAKELYDKLSKVFGVPYYPYYPQWHRDGTFTITDQTTFSDVTETTVSL